jgi:hypothetical protein
MSSSSKRPIVGLSFVAVAAAAALAVWVGLDTADQPIDAMEDAGSRDRPHVIFIVLDAVRADRLSLCGYSRPTSPGLERLVDLGAAATCRAYAPSPWTLPSHASFFTGLEVPEHRADNVVTDEQADGSIRLWRSRKVPLAQRFETLAERFRADGYRTVSVSGNPLISRWAAAGLDQGFDEVKEARRFGDLYGARLVAAVERALGETEPGGQPLFLFVNVSDAHVPWKPVPDELGWAPAGPGFRHYDWYVPTSPFARLLKGELAGDQRRRFEEQLGNAYDFAVRRSDETLQGVVDALGHQGFLERPFRMVVTSDHGEFLGEHDLVGHFTFTYEECTRVPLVYWEGSPAEPLPEPTAALHAYDLLLTGELPRPARPARSMGNPTPQLSELFGEHLQVTTAASWSAGGKTMWIDGELYDVELSPGSVEQLARAADAGVEADPSFSEFVTAIEGIALGDEPSSAEMERALEALGYLR